MDFTNLMAKQLPMAIETNEPIPKKSSSHAAPLFSTIIFFACIGVGTYLFIVQIIPLGGILGMILGSYLLYLIMGVFCNKTGTYLNNSKSFQQYQQVYYKMRDSKGYFRFHSESYHYETIIHHHTSTDADGNTRHYTTTQQRKIVTHTATQNLIPLGCKDISGHIEQIYDSSELIFFRYNPKFQFDSLNSQRKFEITYNQFKRYNNRDVHQDTSYQFIIPGFIQRISFFTGKPQGASMFYLWGMFGFVYFYSIYKERKVSRYHINIVKRLTL